MVIRYQIEEAAGIVCKLLFPLPVKSFYGNGKKVAVCTLSSLDLLQSLSKNEIMDKILIAGRLFSENKGIDDLINSCINSKNLKYLIVCGLDTKGHYSGDALIKLMENGVDSRGYIIKTYAPRPFLTSSQQTIEKFRTQIKVIDLRGSCNLEEIAKKIKSLN